MSTRQRKRSRTTRRLLLLTALGAFVGAVAVIRERQLAASEAEFRSRYG